MMMSLGTLVSSATLAAAWNTPVATQNPSPSSETDTTVAISPINGVSTTPIYGTDHDQKVAVKFLEQLETTVPSLKDATFSGLTFESLTEARKILMGINSTANLSSEQKSVLEAATHAWLEQNPSEATKVNDPEQARTVARNVADIFKKLILSNYTAATTATVRASAASGRVALLGSKEFKTFFDERPTTQALAQEREEIGTPIMPIGTIVT